MMKVKLRELKELLKIIFKQKSIKVSKDGTINIIFRFKPGEMENDVKQINDFTATIVQKIIAITNVKYQIIEMQKQPSFCYNNYVRLLNISSAASTSKIKRFLKYFTKQNSGEFVKTSYSEIEFRLKPYNTEEFEKFIIDSEIASQQTACTTPEHSPQNF